jgi:hypothetical protein
MDAEEGAVKHVTTTQRERRNDRDEKATDGRRPMTMGRTRDLCTGEADRRAER